MMRSFKIRHVAGKSNYAADALSRNPATGSVNLAPAGDSLAAIGLEPAPYDEMEADIIAGAQTQIDATGAISWAELRNATKADQMLQLLTPLILSGFPAECHTLPDAVQPYWQYWDRLSIIDGVIMMDSRMVVPICLRANILNTLHAAH